MESSTAIDTRLPPRSLVIGKNSSPLVKVGFIAWPSPPTREKRIFKRQRPSKDQQEVQDTSSGVFASREVQEYAADGISVMQLLLGQWHKSLARDMKYFRSFSVYGLVKLQEARNATQFLGGGVNNTVTCCSWELLTQLFSTIPPPAGPALMSVLAHLVHPLFSNVDHVLRHIANVAKKGNANVNDDLASSSTSSSSFDAGAITYQEVNARLLNKIHRLEIESSALDYQRKASAKESAKRQLLFNGTISIWQKGLKKFVLMAWYKTIKHTQRSIPKLMKVLFGDRGNPKSILRLVLTSWRSIVHIEMTKRLLPMSTVWQKKAEIMQEKLNKLLVISKREKKQLKEAARDLNVSLNHVKNKERQIDLLAGKLTRLDKKMEPVKATLKLFAQAAVDVWQVYSETLLELMKLGARSRDVPSDWLRLTLQQASNSQMTTGNGMGLGIDIDTGKERLLFSSDVTTFVPAMFEGDRQKKSKRDKHLISSPVTNYLVSVWNRGDDGKMAFTLIENLNKQLSTFSEALNDEETENNEEGGGDSKNIAAANQDTNQIPYSADTSESLAVHFGVREEALEELKQITDRSKKTDRSRQLSAAGIMHYFLDDMCTSSALVDDSYEVLKSELGEKRDTILHATIRSAELDEHVEPGDYEEDTSGLSRAQLAKDAVVQWKDASETFFLFGGTLGSSLSRGRKLNGALKFGTHVQGWHMLSRHCHTVKDRQRKRAAAKNQGKDSNVLSLAVAMYGSFNRVRLTKVVEADMQLKAANPSTVTQLNLMREVDALAALTLEFAPEIRGWYIRYSSVKGMGSHDFYLFAKQIKVLSRSFRLVDIDLVRVASGAGDADDQLSPPEFVEALIRLSLKRYSSATNKGVRNEAFISDSEEEREEIDDDDDGAGDEKISLGSVKSKRAVDRVRRLLLENVGKYAHKVDIDSFRARFADPDVQDVLLKRRRWLMGKFREYCAADGTQAASSDQAMYTMNLTEWDKFLRDHNVFDHRFKNRSSATLFVCAQAPHAMDDKGSSLESALEDNQELIYQEFLEAIVALAHFRFPDPFIPLSTRVATMLDKLDEAKPLNRYFASNRFAQNSATAH